MPQSKNNKFTYLIPLILLAFFCTQKAVGQQFFHHPDSKIGKVRIPFEYDNNFIVVQVMFNNFLPLKFIFDTGAEHTILTKREITDLMQVPYRRKFPIRGADMSTIMYAYLATGISLQLDNFKALNRPILVLEEDLLGFEEFSGLNVQGILGADVFRRYVVKIDYLRQYITLYDPQRFTPPKKFIKVPLEIKNGKPYVFSNVKLLNDIEIQSKLLLDTGAGLALLLYTSSDKRLDMPENVIRSTIGMGLGGNLEGFIGRVNEFQLEDFDFYNVITNYQEMYPISDTVQLNNRNGILGNVILDRFSVIIDYPRSCLYLKPLRKRIRKKFQYDRSGIIAVATGEFKERLTVFYVIPESPADEAGVRPGDEITRINGTSARNYSLDRLSRKFRAKPGKRISLQLLRDEVVIETSFELRDLI